MGVGPSIHSQHMYNHVLIADAGNLSIATSTAISTTTRGNTPGESNSLIN